MPVATGRTYTIGIAVEGPRQIGHGGFCGTLEDRYLDGSLYANLQPYAQGEATFQVFIAR